jgi:hypothetical protein
VVSLRERIFDRNRERLIYGVVARYLDISDIGPGHDFGETRELVAIRQMVSHGELAPILIPLVAQCSAPKPITIRDPLTDL